MVLDQKQTTNQRNRRCRNKSMHLQIYAGEKAASLTNSAGNTYTLSACKRLKLDQYLTLH